MVTRSQEPEGANAIDETTVLSFDDDYPDVRQAIRAICSKYPGRYWRDNESADTYPEAFVDELTKSGFLAALIPEDYGGSGLPLRAACVILEEIHASGCNAGACHAQMYIMGTLLRHGSEEQKRRWLPEIAAGKLRLQAFAVTEPTTGSDTTQLKTRAELRGDRYVINGQKVWTSRALQSDLMLLLARTTPPERCKKRSHGLSVFVVDLREAVGKGLDIRKLDTAINHQTTEIFFDDVEVPAENLIGEQDKGFYYILDGLNAERILVASECLGDARYFIEKATTYAKERVVFGRAIGQNQGIQFPLARAYANYRSAHLMTRAAAAQFDAGRPCGEAANLCKLIASEASWFAGETAMQTFGGFSYARDYDIERKWRETRIMQIAPISTNLILAYIGQHVLGLPRSY